MNPITEATLPQNTRVRAADSLYVSRRAGHVLVVEPETASWCILDDARFAVLSDIAGGRLGVSEWDAWATIEADTPPRPLTQIAGASTLHADALGHLIQQLWLRNMITLDGASYMDPSTMWDVQTYPHYYNIHMTEACNLACTYCRVYSPKKAPMMTPETCALIVRRCIEELPTRTALVSFHGGEPMLNRAAIEAGAREAHRAVEGTGKQLKIMMQTNGTLLSPKTVAWLKDLGVHVGVSIDGPQPLNDSQRVFHTGKGSYMQVMRGVSAARDGGLPVGFIAVIHDPTHYVEVLDFLVREQGARSVRINHSSAEGRAGDELDFPVERAELFAREWLKMVDYAVDYHRETGTWLDISDLNLFVTHLVSKARPHMCYRSPCGVGNSMLGFSHGGEIYACEEAMGNPLFRLGDIHDPTSLKDLIDRSPVRQRLMKIRNVENLQKCSTCSWRRFHGAGCATKTYAYFGTILKEDPMCRFYHVVFEALMWRLWENPELVNLAYHYVSDPTERAAAIDALAM